MILTYLIRVGKMKRQGKVGVIIVFNLFFFFLYLGEGGDKGKNHTQPPNSSSSRGWGIATQHQPMVLTQHAF